MTTKNHPELKPKAAKGKETESKNFSKRNGTAIAMEKKRQPESQKRAAMGRTSGN